MLATPWGFRDILPEEAAAREEISDAVTGCFKRRGYLPVETAASGGPRRPGGERRAQRRHAVQAVR